MISQARGFGLDLVRKVGMGALRGNGTIPGPPYCDTFSSYADEAAYFGYEDCSGFDTVPTQLACSQNNMPAQIALSNFQIGCSYTPGKFTGGASSSQIGEEGAGMTTPIAPTSPTAPLSPTNGPSPGVSSNAGLTFQNITTGNSSTFATTDSYLITITGALANAPVVVSSIHNGAPGSAQQGTTDSNGNFSMGGPMDPSVIGNWTETWTVGGMSLNGGTFSFSVVAASSPPLATSNPTPATPTPVSPSTLPLSPSSYPNTVSTNTTPPATNTTNTGVSSNFGSDFVLGLENIINPGNWGAIFSSGDLASILGLVTPMVVGGFMLMEMMRGRR